MALLSCSSGGMQQPHKPENEVSNSAIFHRIKKLANANADGRTEIPGDSLLILLGSNDSTLTRVKKFEAEYLTETGSPADNFSVLKLQSDDGKYLKDEYVLFKGAVVADRLSLLQSCRSCKWKYHIVSGTFDDSLARARGVMAAVFDTVNQPVVLHRDMLPVKDTLIFVFTSDGKIRKDP